MRTDRNIEQGSASTEYIQQVCLYRALKLGPRKQFYFEKLKKNTGKYFRLVRKIKSTRGCNLESNSLQKMVEFLLFTVTLSKHIGH